jgi:transposase
MLKPNYDVEPTAVDRQVFDALIAKDHYLRRLKQVIDFEAMRPLMADAYSATMGRGAEDPVRMLKLSLLQAHYDLSDRDVIARAAVDVSFRFLLDLSLESPLPDPSSLVYFRRRLGPERFRAIFDHVVAQARTHGLVGDRLRLKDATHLLASVAIPTTLQLVAQARDHLLRAAEPFAADVVEAHRAEAKAIRTSTRDLKDVQRLAARVAHLERIIAWAEVLVEQVGAWRAEAPEHVRPHLEQGLREAVALARQIVADREEGAKDRVRSVVDPDVRTIKHGGFHDGYLLDLCVDADSELITSVDVLAANADEAANAKELIESEEEAHGNNVEAISIDGIGYRGDVLEALSGPGGPEVEVFVPVHEWSGRTPGTFGPEAFRLSDDRQQVTCPGGQTTRQHTRSWHGTGERFVFRLTQCRDCPLRRHCQSERARTGRVVTKSDYERQYGEARRRAESAAYRQVRREHARVERKLADVIRNHGGRRVRYRGLKRVKVQYVVASLAANAKRIVNLLTPKLAPLCTPS